MLFRSLHLQPDTTPKPAYTAFLHAQKSGPPDGVCVLLQNEHSHVAGQLARALNPAFFGALPGIVIDAISEHDAGWNDSDQHQLHALPERKPLSFVDVDAENTLPCWLGSIQRGRELGPLAAVLISRHCCLLGTGSDRHASFVADETARRAELEAALPFSPAELDRWTAALGFCDLLSLYLCCGSQSPVSLPLAHPQKADGAETTTLIWANGAPHLSPSVLNPGSEISGQAFVLSTGAPPTATQCYWRF